MDGNESTVWGRKDLWESSKEDKIAWTRVQTLRQAVPSFLQLLGLMHILCLLETGAPFLSPPTFPCILGLKINMALLILWLTIPVLYQNRTGLLPGPYPLVFHSLRLWKTASSSCTMHGNMAGVLLDNVSSPHSSYLSKLSLSYILSPLFEIYLNWILTDGAKRRLSYYFNSTTGHTAFIHHSRMKFILMRHELIFLCYISMNRRRVD